MTRRFRLWLASMALAVVLGSGVGAAAHQASAITPLDAVVGKFIARTIAAKHAERRDRADINERRDQELAQVDVQSKVIDRNESIGRITPEEAKRQRAQVALLKMAIEERAKRERQIVSFETRRRIDANLKSSFKDAVTFGTGADPKAVEFLSGLIDGKKPLDAAFDALQAGPPEDPLKPFRDLKDQLKEVDKAARALGGKKAVDLRARIRAVIDELNPISEGDAPPPDDKLARLKDLDAEVTKAAEQARDILKDLFPGSPGIDRSRFEGNERWQQLDAAVEDAEKGAATQEVVSSILRRATEEVAQQAAESGRELTPEEIDRIAGEVLGGWVDGRQAGTGADAPELDLGNLARTALAEDDATRGILPANPDEEASPSATTGSEGTREASPSSSPEASPGSATIAPDTPGPTSANPTAAPTSAPKPTSTVAAQPTARPVPTRAPTPLPTAKPTSTPTKPPTSTPVPAPTVPAPYVLTGTFTLTQSDSGCSFSASPFTSGSVSMNIDAATGAVSGTMNGGGSGSRNLNCQGSTGTLTWSQGYTITFGGTISASGALSVSGTIAGSGSSVWSNCKDGGQPVSCPANGGGGYSFPVVISGAAPKGGGSGGIQVLQIGLATSGSWNAN
ncbi:MAG: hypothetical protein AB7J35_20505 [Dehalococcoidia bacterium]